MADQEHLNILKQGVETWNKWRHERPDIRPDLRGADLNHANLRNVDLGGADLSRANLLSVDFREANLCRANLNHADLHLANLENANLRNALLGRADLSGSFLANADLSEASLWSTIFAENDLSEVKGLEIVKHGLPSTIGIDTLYRSGGKIPEVFLRGAGVPDVFINYLPSLVNAEQATQYYSCFISYSTKDEEFAKRLHSRLQQEHVRAWIAPEDMKGGRKLEEQIDEAIRVHDKLLIVLSENSIHSEWVKTEIRRACKAEVKENCRKLFPLGIADYEIIKDWKLFDADLGKDLAVEVREYFIPGFASWKNQDAFEKAFKRLLKDLQPKATAKQSNL